MCVHVWDRLSCIFTPSPDQTPLITSAISCFGFGWVPVCSPERRLGGILITLHSRNRFDHTNNNIRVGRTPVHLGETIRLFLSLLSLLSLLSIARNRSARVLSTIGLHPPFRIRPTTQHFWQLFTAISRWSLVSTFCSRQ